MDNFNEIKIPIDIEKYDVFDQVGVELDAIGGYFSWADGYGVSHTKSKFDWALESVKLLQHCQQVHLRLLEEMTSDHAVLVIDLIALESKDKPFSIFNSSPDGRISAFCSHQCGASPSRELLCI